MTTFGVVLVAVDDYPEPPGPLPSSDSAARFGAILGGGRGGNVLDTVVVHGEGDLVDAVRRWAEQPDRPTGSVVYLVGHGRGDSLDHDLLVPDGDGVLPVRTSGMAQFLQRDWQRRQTDPDSWALFVLDCCDSELGVTNLAAELSAKYPKKPKRLGLWPVAPGGAARTGAFVTAFEHALDTFTENDERIPLDEVFRRIRRELGDLEPAGFLPPEAALERPPPPSPVVMALDVREELRLALAALPAEVSGHFIEKAQGSEVGEVAWHFAGRDREVAELSAWLAHGEGLKVVTGEAGSGKSALLGHLVVLADPKLVALYTESGLAPHLAARPRPPGNVFAVVLHLTGQTALEVVDDLSAQLDTVAGEAHDQPTGTLDERVRTLLDQVRGRGQDGATVLVDALDEAQEPEALAVVLQQISLAGALRVLVGTRRSVTEGPDQPADPTRRDLLDALGVAESEVLVVERDPAAVHAYAVQRLVRDGSPYEHDTGRAAALADRITERDQPFLFARLATAELLARPALAADDPALDELLSHGHRGVFAAALERVAGADPGAVEMLRALAHARGSGMPRTGGTWVDAARAVGQVDDGSDARVDATVAVAGPYVTLDAEAGQSTYRLAHQTFVEHFHAEPGFGEGHRRIAAQLAARQRAAVGGWDAANHYVVRYLPEHLVADADRTPPDGQGLAHLVTDAGWLHRAVLLLGVDRTLDVIVAARTVFDWDDQVDWAFNQRAADAVERALRRSRISLARDPGQLAGQLHARLSHDDDEQLAGLGDAVGEAVGQPWLRMVEGRLDWSSDLESVYGLVGKVRGVAFGVVDDDPMVAIAVDTRVVLWDPRRGVDDVREIEVGVRPTGVALGTIGGRPVVVTTAGYDGRTDVWDARSSERLGGVDVSLGFRLAVGRVGGRQVIAGAPVYGEIQLLDAASLARVEPHPDLRLREVLGFGVDEGRLVVLGVESAQVVVVDPADGNEIWRSVELTAGPGDHIDVAAGARVGPGFVVAVGMGSRTWWLTEGNAHIEESPHGVRLRSVAVGAADLRPIVVSAPDFDATALVELHEIGYRQTGDELELFRTSQYVADRRAAAWFEDVPLPEALAVHQGGRADGPFTLDAPERWPHTATARGDLDGAPVLLTGSVDGSAWVWDTSTDPPTVVAGPFRKPGGTTLEWGWRALGVKPAAPTAASVALGHHRDHGAVAAVACDGRARLYTVPGGLPVPGPSDDATVVDAVALGQVNGRDVLITGSKGGVVVVWDVAGAERVAALTLDDPVRDLTIAPGPHGRGQVAVKAGADRLFVLDLVEP